ncbi:hypothetical protein JXI42_03500 [bacterium]|nr:hypothetical protein [bacterium]
MLIGEILTEKGFCQESDIIGALDLQQNGDNRLLGQILIAMEKISEGDLLVALEAQLDE